MLRSHPGNCAANTANRTGQSDRAPCPGSFVAENLRLRRRALVLKISSPIRVGDESRPTHDLSRHGHGIARVNERIRFAVRGQILEVSGIFESSSATAFRAGHAGTHVADTLLRADCAGRSRERAAQRIFSFPISRIRIHGNRINAL